MLDDPNRLRQWLPVAMIVAGAILLIGIFVLHWPVGAGFARLSAALLVLGLIRLFRDPKSADRSASGVAGLDGTTVGSEFQDPGLRRAKAAVVVVPAVAILAFGLKPGLMPIGGIFTRVLCVFTAYGLYKLARSNGLIGPPPPKTANRSWIACVLLESGKTGVLNPLGKKAEIFWRIGSGVGIALMLALIPCLIEFWLRMPTVVISGDFDILSWPLLFAMVFLAAIVGISWARRTAPSLTRLFFSSAILGLAAFSGMLTLAVIGGSQFAEARAFSGITTTRRQEFRIWWAYTSQDRGVHDYAVINPYYVERRTSALLPKIPITPEAFDLIRKANPEAPVNDHWIFFSPHKSVRSTSLCFDFDAQRSGPYERLLLSTTQDIGIQSIHPCTDQAR